MKKISIYAILSIFLFSCETRENEVIANENNDYLVSGKNSSSGASFVFTENKSIMCGSSDYGNPFTYVPTKYGFFVRYTTDRYNVYFSDDDIDNCNSNNGKQCVTLSKFVGAGLVSLAEMKKINWYFGEQEYGSGPGSNTEVFTVGQDGYNEQMYGDLFWSPNYYMTDIAANSVRQKFKDKIDELKAQNKKITSVSIYTKALLCIPSYKHITVQVKYDLN